MNEFAIWTFAAALITLVASDALGPDPRDEIAPPIERALTVGDLCVTARLAPVGGAPDAPTHAWLELTGSGRARIQLRLQETQFNPLSRIMPLPEIAWERSLALDAAGATSIDLGPWPTSSGDVLRQLQASADGLAFVELLAPQLLGEELFSQRLDSLDPLLFLAQPVAQLRDGPSPPVNMAPPMIAARPIAVPR